MTSTFDTAGIIFDRCLFVLAWACLGFYLLLLLLYGNSQCGKRSNTPSSCAESFPSNNTWPLDLRISPPNVFVVLAVQVRRLVGSIRMKAKPSSDGSNCQEEEDFDASQFQAHIAKLARALRIQSLNRVGRVVNHMVAVCVALWLYIWIREWEPLGGIWGDSYEPVYFTRGFLPLALVYLVGFSIFNLMRDKVTIFRMEVLHFVVMARMFWQLMYTPTIYLLLLHRMNLTLQRLVLGWILGSARLTSVLNGAFCAGNIFMLYTLATGSEEARVHFGRDYKFWCILEELMTFCVISATTFALESRNFSEARASTEEAAVRTERSAVRALLDTLCDVVVELNTDLRIVDRMSTLTTWLLHATSRSLRGCQLQDFMPMEEDRVAYMSLLHHGRPPDHASAAVSSVRVRMRDSLNNTMHVELFPVKFAGSDGRPRHLVGLREFTDVLPVAPPRLRPEEDGPTSPSRSESSMCDLVETGSEDSTQSDFADGRNIAVSSACPPAPVCHRPTAGTPSVSWWERLHQDPPEAVRPDRQHTSSSKGLVLPNLRETLPGAMQLSVVQMLMTWNVCQRRVSCCPLHATLYQLRCTMKVLERCPCAPRFRPWRGWQCPWCGVLDASDASFEDATGRCAVCATLPDGAPTETAGSGKAVSL